jgi:hypothetical protein
MSDGQDCQTAISATPHYVLVPGCRLLTGKVNARDCPAFVRDQVVHGSGGGVPETTTITITCTAATIVRDDGNDDYRNNCWNYITKYENLFSFSDNAVPRQETRGLAQGLSATCDTRFTQGCGYGNYNVQVLSAHFGITCCCWCN